MMNKFHKTTYSRQHNFNAISSSHGKRNLVNPPPHSQWFNSQKMQMPIERKIDIQSTLFISHKNHPQQQTSKPVDSNSKKPVNRSEAKFYETSAAFTQIRERPQSKQEPRLKGPIEGKIKTEAFHPQRPLTSKGARKIRGNISQIRERQTTQNDEEFPIQIKVTQKKTRNAQTGYTKRLSNQSNVLAMETSIDPQFLALFAN